MLFIFEGLRLYMHLKCVLCLLSIQKLENNDINISVNLETLKAMSKQRKTQLIRIYITIFIDS